MAGAGAAPIGLVAGSGALPRHVADAIAAQGRTPVVVALTPFADLAALAPYAPAQARIGAAGRILTFLKQRGVSQLCVIGGVRRPGLAALRPDRRALGFLARGLWPFLTAGDDGLLRAVAADLARDGLGLIDAALLAPDLLVGPGPLGRVGGPDLAGPAVRFGVSAALRLGVLDRGQAVVVRDRAVLAEEGRDGTDAMLAALGNRGRGGMLVKLPKPGQTLALDRPAIGPGTVAAARAAGLSAIVIAAQGTIVVDRDRVAEAADAAGIAVVAIPPGPLVFLSAGEPSGDLLGARVLAGLPGRTGPGLRVIGIGGDRLREQGLASLFPMADIALFGLAEILPKLWALRARLALAARAVARARPTAVVTIDAPGFNFRLARRAAETRPRPTLIHWVAPTVWAWKPGRAKRIAGFLDHLMVLLPFEPPYFERHGLDTTFTGHPILRSGAGDGRADRLRERLGLAPTARVICLLPGSRRSEVTRLLPVFRETLTRLKRDGQLADTVLVIPTVPLVEPLVRAGTIEWADSLAQVHIVTGDRDKYDAFAAAAVALAASGTVSLELALARVPTVVAYQVHPVTAALARRLIRVRYVSIVNLVLDRMAIPERLQEAATPAALAADLTRLLSDPDAAAAQRAAFETALRHLGAGEGDPADRAAACIAARRGGPPGSV